VQPAGATLDVNHLLLIRHGETVGNLTQIAHGQSESPLNERGSRQADATARRLSSWARHYHRIYSSPLERARHTGERIATSLGLALDVHEHLVEGSLGDWEGVTYEELHAFGFARHSIADDDFMGHGGESPNQLGQRMFGVVEQLRALHPGENVICVSHGAAIAHLLAKLLGTRPAFGHQYLMHNAAITEVAFLPQGGVDVLILNEFSHLPDDLRSITPAAEARRR